MDRAAEIPENHFNSRQYARRVLPKPNLSFYDNMGDHIYPGVGFRRKQSHRYFDSTTNQRLPLRKHKPENHVMKPENFATEAAEEAVDNTDNLDTPVEQRYPDSIGMVPLPSDEDWQPYIEESDGIESNYDVSDEQPEEEPDDASDAQKNAAIGLLSLLFGGDESAARKAFDYQAKQKILYAMQDDAAGLENGMIAFAAVHQLAPEKSFGWTCANPYHPHVGNMVVYNGRVTLVFDTEAFHFTLAQLNQLIGKLRRVRNELQQQIKTVGSEAELLDNSMLNRFIIAVDETGTVPEDLRSEDITLLEDQTQLIEYLDNRRAEMIASAEEEGHTIDQIPELVEKKLAQMIEAAKPIYQELYPAEQALKSGQSAEEVFGD